jgi:peroxiredoxin
MKQIASLAAGIIALAISQASALSVGDQAPDFTLTSTTGTQVTLSQSAGQVRVLFFFGCG